MVDGIVYISTAWSLVYAFDAATGERLWSYDPQTPRQVADQRLLRRGQSRRRGA